MGLKEDLQVLGGRTADTIRSVRYNYLSSKSASRALSQIEKQSGKLDAALRKKADEYAIEVLGGGAYAPWLYVYSALSGTFKEGWIPDNYYHLKVIQTIQGEYGKISFLKPLNQKIFTASVSPDIAFFIHGRWFDHTFSQIRRNDIENLCFSERKRGSVGAAFEVATKVVFKTDTSYQGRGVLVLGRKGFDVTELENKGNGTLQRFILQHPFFSDLLPESVANVRLTTVIDNSGRPDLRACYLRLGRLGDTHVKSDSHVRIPVDPGSGDLWAEGYLSDWKRVGAHPDSQVSFANKKLPGYEDCVRAVLNMHLELPMVRAIGWDMIVDSELRPVLMEWNGYGNDIKFSEATQGPCFHDLGWVP